MVAVDLEGMAKRIVNSISAHKKKIYRFPSYGEYFSRDRNGMVIKSLDVYFGQSYSSVEHQYTLVGQNGSDKMSAGFFATSDNFTNGSDNVRYFKGCLAYL